MSKSFKYVDKFEFPESAGFTGSRQDRVAVRPHVRGYARGGAVKKYDGGGPVKGDESKAPKTQSTSPPPSTPAPKGDTIQAPKPTSTVDALKNQTARKMAELGLKRGGSVGKNTGTLGSLARGSGGSKFAKGGRKYAEGGQVLGNSAVKRDVATTQNDEEHGGKSPLLPGFAKGGRNFIKGAIKHPGAFRAKAEKAGMSTGAYAAKVTKPGSHASSTTKKQAGLAKTLSKLRPKAMGGPVKMAAGGLSGDAKTTIAPIAVRKMQTAGGIPAARGNSAGAPQARRQVGPRVNVAPALKRAYGGKVNY